MRQPTLLDALDEGLCRYGTPPPGEADRPCNRRATHGARWRRGDQAGGLDCCRDHANYYATAWAYSPRSPDTCHAAGVEILHPTPQEPPS